ncbi:serine-aspartate repeat-containing protein F-like isoform X2 [Gigantopelta aegis]|uniref:serine-aspartate repeat-containing protein F-like isoform X2 n=1 Tax=Gigantopelta aegis TaxID=1735272 RepID=UPI001B888945|nr:serine-aspartate repeat-containing protein F-like isoform X2 [Gigantopelta aegis]
MRHLILARKTQRHNSTDEFEVHQYSTETDLDTDWDTDSVTDTESETHSDRGDQSRKPLPEPPDSSKELVSKTQEIPPTSTRPDPTQTTSDQQLPDEDEKRESEKLQKTDHYVSKGVNLFNNADDSGDGVSGAQSPHVSDTTQTQTGGDISKGAMEKGKTKQKTTTQQQKSTVKAEVHQHSTETDLDTDWDTDTVTDAKSETHSDHGDQFREPQPVPPDSSKEPDPTQSTSNQKQLPAANNTYDSVYLGTNNCASLKIDSSVKSNQEEQGGEELKTESLHADEKQESEELQNKYQYLSKGVNFFHDADDSGEAVSGAQSPHVTDMTQTQTGGEPERDDRKMDDTEYETVARKQDTEAEQDNKETDKDGDLTKSEDPVSRHSPQEDGHDRAPDTDAKKTEDASMEENDSTDEESCVGRAQREQRMLKFHQEHETPQKIEEDKNHSKICTIV